MKSIKISKVDGTGWITLNRPEVLNAMNGQMVEEMDAAVNDLGRDPSIRVVVLTGEGRAFCAGGDLKEISALTDAIAIKNFVEGVNRLVFALASLEKPVITAVNGVAAGAGCNLALTGDIILASDKARFSEAFVNVGLIPDAGGTYLLTRLVGPAKAKELILTGDMVAAQEALRIGMVNRVIPAEVFIEEVQKLANKLAVGPRNAMAFSKRMVDRSYQLGLAASLDYEIYVQTLCLQGEEFEEGLEAFDEKRPPRFP